MTGYGPGRTAAADAGGAISRRKPTLDRSAANRESGDTQGEFAAYETAMKQLRLISDQTGGRMNSPRRIEDLSGIYSDIADDLRIQYQQGYNPTNVKRDGQWREIRVKIKGHPEAVVRTRKGYFVRKEAGG